MAAEVTFYEIPLAEAHEHFKDTTGLDAAEWRCGCGCEGITLVARDERALWIMPTLRPTPLVVIKGFQTYDELEQFVVGMKRAAARSGDLRYVEQLAEYLVERFGN